MATTITTANIKARLLIPAGTTTWDTDLALLATQIGAGVDGAAGTAPAAMLVESAIMIAAGTAWLAICNLPAATGVVNTAAISGGGVSIGETSTFGLTKDNAIDLIKTGWSMLAPWSQIDTLAKAAESAFAVLLAQARDDDVAVQADAELSAIVNAPLKTAAETSLLAAEKLKVDAEELRIDAATALLVKEALTEVQNALKVIADTALSNAYAVQATAVAAVHTERSEKMVIEASSLLVDVASVTDQNDGPFALDSLEYD